MKSSYTKRFFPLGENNISLHNIYPVKQEIGEGSDINCLFKSEMFNNLPTQDDLYHYFGVLTYRPLIYTTRKQDKGTIWHMMPRLVLDIIELPS